jgi:hypothetical protein
VRRCHSFVTYVNELAMNSGCWHFLWPQKSDHSKASRLDQIYNLVAILNCLCAVTSRAWDS